MLSERKWRPESVIHMLIVLFTSICILKIAAFAMQFLLFDWNPKSRELLGTVLGAITFQGIIIACVAVFLKLQHLSWNDTFGFATRPGKSILYGIAGGLLFVPVAWAVVKAASFVLPFLKLSAESQETVQTFQKTIVEAPTPEMLWQQIAFGISVIILAPIAEEILFRGIIYPTFKQLGLPRLALWGSSILFAVIHNNVLTMTSLFVLALCLVAIYEMTDNLLAPIVMHSIFNTVNFFYLIYEAPINRWLNHA